MPNWGGTRRGSGPPRRNVTHGRPSQNSTGMRMASLANFFVRSNNASARDDHQDAGQNSDLNQDANTPQQSNMHPTQEEKYSEEGMNEPELVNPKLFCKQSKGRSLSGIVEEQIEGLKKQNIARVGQACVQSLTGRGNPWEKWRVILHKDIKPPSMKKSWEEFHKLHVFHWVPSELLAQENKLWMPLCPNRCGRRCKRNGFIVWPRVVFNTYETYPLNALERFEFSFCKKERSCLKDLGCDKSELKNWDITSLDENITRQVKEKNPGLHSELPHLISNLNALD